MGPMKLPKGFVPTTKALVACVRAMRYLVDEVGWEERDIPALEELWWKTHNEDGNIVRGTPVEEPNA